MNFIINLRIRKKNISISEIPHDSSDWLSPWFFHFPSKHHSHEHYPIASKPHHFCADYVVQEFALDSPTSWQCYLTNDSTVVVLNWLPNINATISRAQPILKKLHYLQQAFQYTQELHMAFSLALPPPLFFTSILVSQCKLVYLYILASINIQVFRLSLERTFTSQHFCFF